MWSKLWAKVKGWRTILAAGLTAVLGIADVFGAIDLRPLVAVLVHGDEAKCRHDGAGDRLRAAAVRDHDADRGRQKPMTGVIVFVVAAAWRRR